MIVVDASAAVSALLNAGPARQAIADQQIHIPHLVDSELASALRRKAAAGQVPADIAADALDAWQRLAATRYPAAGLLRRIWQLRDNVSAYDATYVALAEQLGCDLLTGDARLGRAPGLRCTVTIVPR